MHNSRRLTEKDNIATLVPPEALPSPTINTNSPQSLPELAAVSEQLSDMHGQALLSIASQLLAHCEEQRDAMAGQEVALP